MKKWISLAFAYFVACWSCFAQNATSDTLVYPDEIKYSGAYEKAQFNRFFSNGEEDFLSLFLATSADMDEMLAQQYQLDFYTFLSDLKIKTPIALKPKQRIKTIYKITHDHYFSKYELQTSFPEIFKNGNFNCVSASALYGIILQKSNIPFDVRETPVHVYLVSYPGSEEIKIESTDPAAGYLSFDQRMKKQYIDYMRKNKFISENEYIGTNTNELFDKYYFADEQISLKELLGIQYLNKAAYLFQDQKIKEGYHELEKAYLFYPCKKIEFLMMIALADIVGKETYNELNDADYLVKLTRFNTESITPSMVRDEFAKITIAHLINRSDVDYYEKIYQYLESHIKQKEFLDEIAFVYHFERGRYLLNRSRTRDALPFFEVAYRINPDNADAQVAFVQTLASSMRVMDTRTATSLVEKYASQYESLKTNMVFNNLLIMLYLGTAMDYFDRGELTPGDEYLLKFEALHSLFPGGDLTYDLVGRAYSSAGMHYFRKGNLKKAKEYIQRGLVISPGNTALLYCLTSFE